MRHSKGRGAFIVAFLSPAVLLYAVFLVWPLLQSFQMSMYRWRGVSRNRKFIGMENFQNLSQDPVFWKSLQNTGMLLVLAGIVTIGLGVLLAHLTDGAGPVRKFARAIYLFPQVISLVAVALIWQFQLNPKYGLVTDMLFRLGLPVRDPGIVRDPRYAFGAIAVAFVWHALGFFVLLFSAGLKQISEEIKEASALDGSEGWHRFRHVTWPLLWSVKRTAITYLLIHILTVFALVFVMTEGGPDRGTETIVSYLYEQIAKNGQYGYASALAVVVFAVSMLASLAVLAYFRKDPTAAAGARA